MRKAIFTVAASLLASPAMAAVTGVEGATLAAQGGSYAVTIEGIARGDETIGFTARGGTELIDDDGAQVEAGVQSPIKLFAPQQTGRYDLVVVENDEVLARLPVVVVQAFAKLTVPDAAKPGDDVGIGWDGPQGNDDEITLAKPDDPAENWISVAYPIDNPALVRMPEEEGQYELRYLHRVDGEMQILAFEPIKVDARAAYAAEVQAAGGQVTLDMASTAMTSGPLEVTTGGLDPLWQLAFVKPGEDDPVGYGQLATSDPVELTAPTEPGNYQVIARDGSNLIRARYAVTVVPAVATVHYDRTGSTKFLLEVSWTGPNAFLDEITIVHPNAPASEWHFSTVSAGGATSGTPQPPDRSGTMGTALPAVGERRLPHPGAGARRAAVAVLGGGAPAPPWRLAA